MSLITKLKASKEQWRRNSRLKTESYKPLLEDTCSADKSEEEVKSLNVSKDSNSQKEISKVDTLINRKVKCQNVRISQNFILMNGKLLENQRVYRNNTYFLFDQIPMLQKIKRKNFSGHPYKYRFCYFDIGIPFINKKSSDDDQRNEVAKIILSKKTKYAVLIHSPDTYFNANILFNQYSQKLLIGLDRGNNNINKFKSYKYKTTLFLYFINKPRTIILQLYHQKKKAFIPVYNKKTKLPVEQFIHIAT